MIDSISNLQETLVGIFAPAIINRRNELEREANTDELTGLANRRAFKLAQSAVRREGLAFILFDANNFGKINKLFSHERGDEVLQILASHIGTVAHHFKCRAFRLGGDEFVIVCRKKFVNQIRDAVERHAEPIDFGDFTVSLSGETGASIEEADAKLQSRKRTRKAQDVPANSYSNKNKESLKYARKCYSDNRGFQLAG